MTLRFYAATVALTGFLIGGNTVQAQDLEECIAQGILTANDDTLIDAVRYSCEKSQRKASRKKTTRLLKCLEQRALNADGLRTARQLKTECSSYVAAGKEAPASIEKTRTIESNPYVITPLRQNYVLPYTYNGKPNQTPNQIPGEIEEIDKEEAKLQLSIKVPLTHTDLVMSSDTLYFGFTMKSFWQVYNDDVSAPFRETNYRPELYYIAPIDIPLGSGTWYGRIGIEHESNGRTQALSRSWNRTYLSLTYAQKDWGIHFQPWHRLPEDRKIDDGNPDTPPDADGDDNPDIEDYMGNYELTGAWRVQEVELTGLFRRNFDTGRGAHEIGVSFPLWGRLRGFVQYFEGYGESLVDYNHKNQRIGAGILLTDLL